MCDFLYLTEQNSGCKTQDNIYKKIKGKWKGYFEAQDLEFKLNNGQIIRGKIIVGTNIKREIVENEFAPQIIGSERDNINLNIAVLLYNLKRKRALDVDRKIKPNILLYNIIDERHEALVRSIAVILGECIVLSGQDIPRLKIISDKLFMDFGVMASVAEEPSRSKHVLALDVNLLSRYRGNMNYFGEYSTFENSGSKDYIFPAQLVETVLLASKMLEHSSYLCSDVNKKNIVLISKMAKKYGFIPLFSDI